MVLESREKREEIKKEAEAKLETKGLIKKYQAKDFVGNETSRDDSPNFKAKIKAWTYQDKQTHTYFTSLDIDVQVQDFTGTAELKCPYDSDLMEYWEPIRQTVVIYGSNRGKYKILFVGRVREVKQDGYELSVTLQNYGWKFAQPASTKFVEDNVKNKDGYTIIKLIFEALKIDSWVISPSAKKRLQEVGINEDGNLTLNGDEIEEIPDLLERLEKVDMSEITNEHTIANKLKENKLANIANINYTLQYEEPTEAMQNLSSSSKYTAGKNVYKNAYGSAGGGSNKNNNSGGGGGGQAPQEVPKSQLNMKLCGGKYPDDIQNAIAYYNEYVNNRIAFNSYSYQKAYGLINGILAKGSVNTSTFCKCIDNIRNNSAKPTATFAKCVEKSNNSGPKNTAHSCLTIVQYCSKIKRPDASQGCKDWGLNNHNTARSACLYHCKREQCM